MANSWRTMFPEYQEAQTATPRKRAIETLNAKSEVGSLLTSKILPAETTTPKRCINNNRLSKDNPLSNSMFLPSEPKTKKILHLKNKVSTDNPLNYKIKPAQTERKINTALTASKVGGLPGSIHLASPPRKVKTFLSETYLDFLPGSFCVKEYPDETTRKKIIQDPGKKIDLAQTRTNCKKLKTNKLHNGFSISSQYEP